VQSPSTNHFRRSLPRRARARPRAGGSAVGQEVSLRARQALPVPASGGV